MTKKMVKYYNKSLEVKLSWPLEWKVQRTLRSFGGANCAVASCPFPTICHLAPYLRERYRVRMTFCCRNCEACCAMNNSVKTSCKKGGLPLLLRGF